MNRPRRPDSQLELFGLGASYRAADVLEGKEWPAQDRFPTNRRREHVRGVVWDDLVSSPQATLVAGYSSIAELIQLIADWDDTKHDLGRVRLVFGAEPFNTSSHTFRSDRKEFTAEARTYWLEERGISLRLSAKVLQAIETIEQGRISARFVHGTRRLHAKIFVGVTAATLGSSNFTSYGLDTQFEANARFEAVREKARYREVAAIAQNFWEAAEAWDDELRSLLEDLLHVVSWQEALARACAELLEGVWAERYMTSGGAAELELWPSQRAGIAEALWITENVGSVLVADATGSGKTRMGAHLVRATRDRLWRTGRARRDLTVLVGPPAVVDTWRSEAVGIGLMISTVSHGKLSRAGESGRRLEEEEVRGAQILAVDEAHNFLNTSSKRTQHVRDSLADNVMLFTATPISRGASDLLNLVGLLGPDNFDDATLEVLNRLDRQRRFGEILTPDEIDTVRREIQRFTVRRTKAQINEMVDRDPEAYVHPITGRTCRYPNHDARIYRTGETAQDTNIANAMRPIVDDLSGIAQLERHIAVPPGLQRYYTDEEWLRFRLRSARGLVRHHVLEALRSSRAALVEHLLGTTVAAERFGIDAHFKAIETGDQLVKIDRLIEAGPPEIELACEVDRWLTDPDLWESACRLERTRYTSIGDHVDRISDAREEAKVKLLAGLCARHSLVLAFDRHPITLAVLKEGLRQADLDGADVLVATSFGSQRKKVIQRFAAGEEGRAIALCSDAMSEGLNLQGASCIVHLDLPTTLRVAEQRVGRVDRMDSRHTTIEAWWPQDGPAFATRAYEKLVRRAKDSESLLGSNLTVPELDAVDEAEVVKVEDQIKELDTAALKPWDGIQDALDPVRQIIHGAHPLVTQEIYNHYREERHRVISRVAPLYSKHPWAFFAVAGIAHGAPRWMIIDPREPQVCVTDLTEVVARLRNFLAEDPPKRELDEVAVAAMERCLDIATRAERNLLPRRMLRALDQMSTVLKAWAKKARQAGDEEGATDWLALETLASSPHPKVDPYLVAERWLTLIGPTFEQHRAEARGRRYILLSDIAPRLAVNPLSYDEVAGTFVDLPQATPLDERVSACIIGVPDPE